MSKSIQKYSFSTKANTLKFLQKKIKKSKIEKIVSFTVNNWEKNSHLILEEISKQFSKKIIVRSSAIGEDSSDSSKAGIYESILEINPKSRVEVTTAINNVIKSYKSKKNFNKNNQILIQNQTQNVICSGVIFTRNPENGGPYYVINYEKGGSTTGVTQGLVNNSIKIFRETKINQVPIDWKPLLKSVKEIERILDSSSLDIEWGTTATSKIVIFQVRPITSFQLRNIQKNDTKIEKLIHSFQTQFKKYSKSKTRLSKKQIFSDMTDWNPAEIIGNKVQPLDYSLYDFLIMKDSWYIGREKIGYQDTHIKNLMVMYGDKPYVDVEKSFVSLMPKTIPHKLRKKLLCYYLNELSINPQLHDKVEFELLFTSYDCSTKHRLKKLKIHGFSEEEINLISNSLREFTEKIIEEFSTIEVNCMKQITQMKQNRIELLQTIKQNSGYKILLDSANVLLHDCKNFGAMPFASMARISFISNSILKSLQKEGHLEQKSIDNFMNSINTILYEFRRDLIDFSKKKLSKRDFLKKYGHLRPGTYDISTPRYDTQHSFLNNIKLSKLSHKQNNLNANSISKILSKYGLEMENIDFLQFVKRSLVNREQLKFEFTHNLSDALELISKAGNILGFSREELSYLDFNTIFSNYKKLSKNDIIKYWKQKINSRKKQKDIFQLLTLPAIITSEKDFEIIEYFYAKPNFITKSVITSDVIKMDKNSRYSLENKIILIENADPGFDWIFSKNPSGLITKYGGVASHMAIRCAELGLPAAIGCGDIIFNQLSKASKILLNCNEEKISVLQNKSSNEFLEEQKILKSLGYIK